MHLLDCDRTDFGNVPEVLLCRYEGDSVAKSGSILTRNRVPSLSSLHIRERCGVTEQCEARWSRDARRYLLGTKRPLTGARSPICRSSWSG